LTLCHEKVEEQTQTKALVRPPGKNLGGRFPFSPGFTITALGERKIKELNLMTED